MEHLRNTGPLFRRRTKKLIYKLDNNLSTSDKRAEPKCTTRVMDYWMFDDVEILK